MMNTEIVAYIALGIAAILYAIALNTSAGKRFVDEYTWASVVLGTCLVLATLWFIIPNEYWLKAALAFAVAGTPMVARSLLNRARKS
jgi:hypothetical protein